MNCQELVKNTKKEAHSQLETLGSPADSGGTWRLMA